ILRRIDLARFQDATVVDLGCGSVNPLAFSFLLLMLGARRGVAIDLEPIQDVAIATKALPAAAAWLLIEPERILGRLAIAPERILANLEGFDLSKLAAGDPAGLDAG